MREKRIPFLSRVNVFMQTATKMLLDVNTPPTQLLCTYLVLLSIPEAVSRVARCPQAFTANLQTWTQTVNLSNWLTLLFVIFSHESLLHSLLLIFKHMTLEERLEGFCSLIFQFDWTYNVWGLSWLILFNHCTVLYSVRKNVLVNCLASTLTVSSKQHKIQHKLQKNNE